MNAEEIEKGMLVRLKSGGPTMTVRAVSGSQAYCEYFTDVDRRQGTFEIASLVRVPERDAGSASTAPGPAAS